jgi:hypothetical protein
MTRRDADDAPYWQAMARAFEERINWEAAREESRPAPGRVRGAMATRDCLLEQFSVALEGAQLAGGRELGREWFKDCDDCDRRLSCEPACHERLRESRIPF